MGGSPPGGGEKLSPEGEKELARQGARGIMEVKCV